MPAARSAMSLRQTWIVAELANVRRGRRGNYRDGSARGRWRRHPRKQGAERNSTGQESRSNGGVAGRANGDSHGAIAITGQLAAAAVGHGTGGRQRRRRQTYPPTHVCIGLYWALYTRNGTCSWRCLLRVEGVASFHKVSSRQHWHMLLDHLLVF